MKGHGLPFECGYCEAGYHGQGAALGCCGGRGLAVRMGVER